MWQQELKRLRYRRQIRRQTFAVDEPEMRLLVDIVVAGDWVIDVGANVGHYAKRFSDLVGPRGRVIAFEPVPDTFAILAANASVFPNRNVTLLNMAASDRTTVLGMEIPRFETGLLNYYTASLTTGNASLQVMTMALDALALPHPITVVKIDAEGHDAVVIDGMAQLLKRDHPTLIVETVPTETVGYLESLGYRAERVQGSPNTTFRWQGGRG